MATDKKSFILYTDMIHTVEKLPDEKAGLLLKHLLRYVNDQNPVTDDVLIDIAFEPIKHQLKRDLKKWEGKTVKLSSNGQLGGIKSGEVRRQKALESKQNEAIASNSKQNEANEAVNVNVTVNDTVINNTPKGVVASPPASSIPKVEKNNQVNSKWDDFTKSFNSIGEGMADQQKQTAQRTELKKFIEENKPLFPEPYFTAYRLFALKEGLSIPQTLSESRKKKFKVRIKEPPFDFYKILEGIHLSKFCRGDNNRSWKVDWDWIFENDSNYIKIIENKFD